MKRPLILICLLMVSVVSTAQLRFTLQQNWSHGSLGDDLGMAGIVAKDIDRNGRAELVLTSSASGAAFTTNGYFSVVEYDASTGRYYTKWTSPLYSGEIKSIESFDIDGDGNLELLAGFADGYIRVFDNHYREILSATTYGDNSIFSPRGISSLAFGDIDNDGHDNIVATNGDSTYIFNSALLLNRKIYLAGGKIVLANVDGDPATESIYSKGYVRELSATQTKTEFRFFPSQYSPTRVRVADMNKDGIQDVVFNSQDSVHILSGVLKRKIRSIAKKQGWSTSDVSDFQLYDYTQDGVPDVFAGNDQFEVLYVYDGQTTLFDYDIQDRKRNGVDALAIADIDDQPGPEIIWTSGAMCSCSDHVFVYDMATKANKWMSKYTASGFQAFDFGDIDDPGSDASLELVVGSFGTYLNYFDEDFLSTFDLATKALRNETIEGLTGVFTEDITALEIGDIDNDGKNEILVGRESSYSQTNVVAYDESFQSERTFEVDGMSYVADIEIVDIDEDGKNEVIITSGTHVGGSTHPDEWQNYIYIFDGESGIRKWRSEKLAGMSSRLGNIRVANIDNDPAKEILIVRYASGGWSQAEAALYVIDGWNYDLVSDANHNYTAFDVSDFDKDGRDDIVAATDNGEILVIDGQTFAVKKTFETGQGQLNALVSFDLNKDNVDEYIISNMSRVFIYDAVHDVLSASDALGDRTGSYSSMRIHQNANSGDAELLVSTSHTLFSLKIKVSENMAPASFKLISPVNNAKLPPAQWIEFSWEEAMDDDNIRYSVYIAGNGIDTVLSALPRTHVALPGALFKGHEPYTWSVIANDGLAQTTTDIFAFRMEDELILGVGENENQAFQVYPNPFFQSLVIRNTSSKEIDGIRILDRNGREQVTGDFQIKAFSEFSMPDLSHLPPGMYVCMLMRNGSAVKTTKIVKR